MVNHLLTKQPKKLNFDFLTKLSSSENCLLFLKEVKEKKKEMKEKDLKEATKSLKKERTIEKNLAQNKQ